MNKELQLKIAKELWEKSKGSPDVIFFNDSETSIEELHAYEELLKRGVIKRKNHRYSVCSATKFFIDNNGKTESEIENDKEEYRKDESLRIANESNKISKRANYISWFAIVISLLSVYVTIYVK